MYSQGPCLLAEGGQAYLEENVLLVAGCLHLHLFAFLGDYFVRLLAMSRISTSTWPAPGPLFTTIASTLNGWSEPLGEVRAWCALDHRVRPKTPAQQHQSVRSNIKLAMGFSWSKVQSPKSKVQSPKSSQNSKSKVNSPKSKFKEVSSDLGLVRRPSSVVCRPSRYLDGSQGGRIMMKRTSTAIRKSMTKPAQPIVTSGSARALVAREFEESEWFR